MDGLVTRGLIVCVAASVLLYGPSTAADDAAPRAPRAGHLRAVTSTAAIDERSALALAHRVGEHWAAQDAAGRSIELTIAPVLQERAQRLFSDYQLPFASLVAIEPSTGRVLAYANHSSADAKAGDLASSVTAPAASVFKLVTASALLDKGVGADTRVCYGGGSSRLLAVDLQDDPRRDRQCATLEDALGKSINTVFAKLADRHLDVATLLRYARGFGFGQPLPFELAPPAGPLEIPGDRLEFARTAAGFWHAFMSPLQAALIASTFANDGAMPQPFLIQRVRLADGTIAPAAKRGEPKRVLPAATARGVAHMMLRTVRDGTSRTAFLDGRGRSQLPGVTVAGKTGSLSSPDPYRAYSWWVGFAPAEHPRIALAVLVVNNPLWRIKSSFVAREMLRTYLLEPHAGRSQLAQRAD
jgi:peptidoglycan glycosyltransferase